MVVLFTEMGDTDRNTEQGVETGNEEFSFGEAHQTPKWRYHVGSWMQEPGVQGEVKGEDLKSKVYRHSECLNIDGN